MLYCGGLCWEEWGFSPTMEKDVNFKTLKFLNSFIHGHIPTNNSCPFDWLFTGTYGHTEVAKQPKSWSQIQSLKERDEIPWVGLLVTSTKFYH